MVGMVKAEMGGGEEVEGGGERREEGGRVEPRGREAGWDMKGGVKGEEGAGDNAEGAGEREEGAGETAWTLKAALRMSSFVRTLPPRERD